MRELSGRKKSLGLSDAVTDLVDTLERHKSSALGQSDLTIGMSTVVQDYDDCIRMLNYLRARLIDSGKGVTDADRDATEKE